MIVPLSRRFVPCIGVPVVDRVETRLFTEVFFSACLDCTFCHDSCCQYGATVELPLMHKLLDHKGILEPVVGRPASEWFDGKYREDPDYPGERFTRTRVFDGRCVFLNRAGRGCLLHRHALENNLSVYDWKPLACNLFPVWWDEGALVLPPEIADRELVCLGPGQTLYRSARNDLRHYYGEELVAELDQIEATVLPSNPRSLPLI